MKTLKQSDLNGVRDQMWAQVVDQAGNQISFQVWTQVWFQVSSQVGNQISGQVWNQVYENIKTI